MKILIDIGHPAHVHYFKFTIKRLQNHGHEIFIIARERKFIKELLDYYDLPFINRGKGSGSKFGKFFYMLKADLIVLREAIKFKPDMFLSFSSPYASQVAFLTGKPHISLNDTEHSDAINSIFTHPFCSSILTPDSFGGDLGKKQIRFDNVLEGLYLHKDLFHPSNEIKKELKIKENEDYVIFRLVSFHAHHDFHQQGITFDTKKSLIKLLEGKFKIFISSEEDLPEEFSQYQIKIKPENMHHVLAGATLIIGESATMSSESAMLGTYSVYVNSSPITCNVKIQQEAGISKYFNSSEGVLEYVRELIKDKDLKSKTQKRSLDMNRKFINPTDFLVWFIENYPDSSRIMKNNPNYQDKFKKQ